MAAASVLNTAETELPTITTTLRLPFCLLCDQENTQFARHLLRLDVAAHQHPLGRSRRNAVIAWLRVAGPA